ncbi:MAG: hypothetical protein ACFCUI_06260 [Bernardetiaceae bacterium]
MIPSVRQAYNAAFSQARYEEMLAAFGQLYANPPLFRIAETPVFVPRALKERLLAAGEELIDLLMSDAVQAELQHAIPPQLYVPNESPHTNFLAIDFAITEAADGSLMPQLIELQGFSSLNAFFIDFVEQYRRFFPIPEAWPDFFSGLTKTSYLERFKKLVLNGHDPENVVLLEVKPKIQHTNVDFWATEARIGVRAVCISEVEREGEQLFYRHEGKRIRIRRIFNRVILDDLLKQSDYPYAFNLTEPADVEWCGHPNWFMKISKFCMPFLKSPYNPDCRLLSEYEGNFPEDLDNYVLKPLYSFSSAGVEFWVKPEHLAAIAPEKHHEWMLQRKITYAPLIQTPEGIKVKTEIRLMYFWEDDKARPEPVYNIARLSQGDLIGVKYNQNKTWVGGAIAFFEP